jgi:hypothetical protein
VKIVVFIIALLASAAAYAADSCSSFKQECIASDKGPDNASASAKCERARIACIADCKTGRKYFVGPFNGQQHPISVCS